MSLVLNCVQHEIKGKQLHDLSVLGEVVNLKDLDKDLFSRLSNCPMEKESLQDLSDRLLKIVVNNNISYIHLPIGSPAFMDLFISDLFHAIKLRSLFLHRVYSYSERISKDVVQADGSVLKTSVFNYVGLTII